MKAMGIDIGTTSISMVLLDAESGALLAREMVSHESFIDDGCPVGKTQDPLRILRIVEELAGGLRARFGEPDAIGFTGQMHGMLYLDRAGNPVSPLYTWEDGRGNLPLADGRTSAEILRESGAGAGAAGYGLTTHLYLGRMGQIPAEAVCMSTISDFVAMKMVGGQRPLLSADMAASWGGFDLRALTFRPEALAAAGADPSYLPAVAPVFSIAGETPGGAPVMCSLGDNQASFLGSVRGLEGGALINIGTGSQISFGVSSYVDCQGTVELRPLGEGRYICAGSGLCGGRAYAMLADFWSRISGKPAGACYEDMQAQAREFYRLRGLEGAWQVRTTFSGTRSDPTQRGWMRGIGVDNFVPGAMATGLIAGILEELLEAYAQMRQLTGQRAERLVGSGNGLRKNPLMRRIAEALFEMPLLIPAHEEEAACGAALSALYAAGKAPSLAAAQELIAYRREEEREEGV